jgi:hypothetical protein
MIDCYRDDSVMQHIGVAISDGVQAAARGDFRQAWAHWIDPRNLVSGRAAIRTARAWTGGGRKRLKQPTPPGPGQQA